ncbi:MAG: DUF4251 domain-containing protein [Ferruginibacter sp.]
MKTLKRLIPLLLLFAALIADMQLVTAQKSLSTKEVIIQNLIDSQQYVFVAQYVTPMNGHQLYLTSEYSVIVSRDSIITDLPYFGRAFSAPMNPLGGGIKFTSVDFDYRATPRKKGRWDINIKPNDTRDARQLTMSIYDNGSATLQVASANRQPISFRGNIIRKKTE